MANCIESIFVVSGPSASLAESPAMLSATALTATDNRLSSGTESVGSFPVFLPPKIGMVGSAIMNMKADSRTNMTVFVLIAMQGANLLK